MKWRRRTIQQCCLKGSCNGEQHSDNDLKCSDGTEQRSIAKTLKVVVNNVPVSDNKYTVEREMKNKPAVGKGDSGSDIWIKEDNKYKDDKDIVTQP